MNTLIRLGSAISEGYVEWTLFLSSYAPLFAIFSIRLWDKQLVTARWFLVVAAALAINLYLLFRIRVAPRDVKVATLESGSSEVAAYIATYLLPFLTVGDVGLRDLMTYGVLILLVGIVMTSGQLLHVNPLLSAIGWRLFTVTTTANGPRFFLLSREYIHQGDIIRAVEVRPRLLLMTSTVAH